MAKITETEAIKNVMGQTLPDYDAPDLTEVDPERPSIAETGLSLLQQFNPTYAYLDSEIKGSYVPEAEYSFQAFMEQNNVPDEFAPVLKGTVSAENANDVLKQQEKLMRAEEILSRTHPAISIPGSFLAGVPSLENLLPAVGMLPKATRAGTMAMGAVRGAQLVGGSILLGEAALSAAHGTRSADEVQMNTTIGAIAGAGIGTYLARKYPTLQRGVETDLKAISTNKYPEIEVSPSVGAAKVDYSQVIEGSNPVNMSGKFLKFMSLTRMPLFRGLAKPYKTIKDGTRYLYDSIYKYKDGQNIVSAENMLNVKLQGIDDHLETVNKLVRDVQGIKDGPFAVERSALAGKSKRPADDILKEAMSYINIRADSPDPKIAAITKQFRSIIDEAADNAKDAGLLTDDMFARLKETNVDGLYFPRVANKELMAENPDDFIKRIADYLLDEQGLTAKQARDEAYNHFDELMRIADEDTVDSQVLAKSVLDGDQGIRYLQQRTSKIPDHIYGEYLLKNDSIVLNYAHQINAAAELKRMLKTRFNVEDIKGYKRAVREEHIAYKDQMKWTEKDLNDSLRFADDMYGTFLGRNRVTGEWDSSLRMLKRYTTGAIGGAISVTNLADIGMLGFRHGPLKSIGRFTSAIKQRLTNAKASQEFIDDANDYIYGLKASMNDYIGRQVNPEEGAIRRKSTAEQISDIGSSAFFKSIGFNQLQATSRLADAEASIAKITRAIMKPSDKGNKMLTSLGFDKKTLDIVKEQLAKHSKLEDNVYIPNVKQWSTSKKYSVKEVQDAKRQWQAIVSRDVNAANLVPGRGSIPFRMQNEQLFGAIGMFKSFIFEATQKIFGATINKPDMETLIGLTNIIAMGVMVRLLKDAIAGRDKDYDPTELVLEGMAISGAIGILGEPIFNIAGRGRYAETSLWSFIGGPALGLGVNAGAFISRITDDETSWKQDKKLLRRIIYAQNHIAIGRIFDEIFDDD